VTIQADVMPHDRYQTVKELAERLEVSEATVRQWIKAGELRAIDIGKGWRIADTDLGIARHRRPGPLTKAHARCETIRAGTCIAPPAKRETVRDGPGKPIMEQPHYNP
jgi:excisionase family DNA binding protein